MGMQPITLDIRETLGDGFAESNLRKLIDEEAEYGREVTEIFCNEKQKVTIEKFTHEEKDKKGKKVTVQTYAGVNLRTE